MYSIAPNIGPAVRPLYIADTTVYASKGPDIFVSRDEGRHFKYHSTCPIPWYERELSRSRWACRIGRLGVHALRPGSDGAMTAILRGRILHRTSGGRWSVAFRFDRGSRPLSLAQTDDGSLFFGEYFDNPDRKAVCVYGSDSGEKWEPIYTFPEGTIRHVHAVVHDPYRDGQLGQASENNLR